MTTSAAKRIEPRVFLASGEEVLITQVCTRCHQMKPLKEFGLRRLGGVVRSISQCKVCRSKPAVRPRGTRADFVRPTDA